MFTMGVLNAPSSAADCMENSQAENVALVILCVLANSELTVRFIGWSDGSLAAFNNEIYG